MFENPRQHIGIVWQSEGGSEFVNRIDEAIEGLGLPHFSDEFDLGLIALVGFLGAVTGLLDDTLNPVTHDPLVEELVEFGAIGFVRFSRVRIASRAFAPPLCAPILTLIDVPPRLLRFSIVAHALPEPDSALPIPHLVIDPAHGCQNRVISDRLLFLFAPAAVCFDFVPESYPPVFVEEHH